MMTAAKTGIYPLQILVNYWEVKPARMGVKLNQWLRQGITHVATFVPWQAAEADISHSLVRFLQAVADRKMTVSLFLSPEVGVYYANSGLPKDLFSKPDIHAKLPNDQPAVATLPPNFFKIPSLASPEFLKRYHQFLARMDGMIAELARAQPEVLNSIQVVLSGSFWKYYRNPESSTANPFSGVCGDQSNASEVAYRHYLEALHSDREFKPTAGQSAQKWKKRELETVNRENFHQNSEDVFRLRSTQFIRKKAVGLDLIQAEVHTPEADPSFQYSQVMQLAMGGLPDFAGLDRLISEASYRQSIVGNSKTTPMIHWTGFGAFSALSDSEKQYLVLKSLLLLGGNQGAVLIDESEWFAFSKGFRARAEMLSKVVADRDLSLETRAVSWNAHLWSEGSNLFWPELKKTLGTHARMIASADALGWMNQARLLCIEPSVILTQEKLKAAFDFAARGKTVCLPKTALMTDQARFDLEQFSKNAPMIDMNLGVRYRVQNHGQGQIVIHDETANAHEWKRFMGSMISLAQINPDARVNDSRIEIVQLSRGTEKGSGKAGLFIFNPSRETLASQVGFEFEVSISDLTTLLSHRTDEESVRQGEDAYSSQFELEVPPCGVLPIAVSGIGEEGREKRQAKLTSGLTARFTNEAASSELMGLDQDDLGSVWEGGNS